MARVTRSDILSQDPGEGIQIIEALAPLATGVNEDGTAFTLPVSLDANLVQTVTTNATAAALNDNVTIAVSGMGSATVELRPSGTLTAGTVSFEISYDGGTNYHAIQGSRPADGSTGTTTSWASASTMFAYEFGLPAMVTHLRFRVSTAITGGTVSIRATAAAKFIEPTTSTLLISGNSVIGGATKTANTNAEGISGTLAGTTTAFGTVRDLQGVSSAGVAAGSSRYPDRFRANASGDQPFTIGIEFDSASGFTTFSEAANVVATAGRSGRYFAALDVPTQNRYGRVYVTNTSATAMTTLRVFSTMVG
jgi:hypothetical protein